MNPIIKAVLAEIDKGNTYDLVYFSGVTIVFPNEEKLTEEEQQSVRDILSGEYEYKPVDKESLVNTFMDCHCLDRDYFVFEDKLYINFDVEREMSRADTTINLKNEIVIFIDMLNKIRSDRSPIREYKFY